jgi:diguanylate cyclase (GGDEF)-like protein
MLKQCEREERNFVVAIADLDRLKEVNDVAGHDAGDALIVAAGLRIQGVLRAGDTVARLGGDEFALLIGRHCSADDLQDLQKRILKEFATPVVHREHTIECGISIGAARYPEDGEDFDSLYRAADKALYAAKSERRKHANQDQSG